MNKNQEKLSYDVPVCGCIRLDPAGNVCNNTSPNHPGGDIPWYPGEDDDEL